VPATAGFRFAAFAVVCGLAWTEPLAFASPPNHPATAATPPSIEQPRVADVQLGDDGSLPGIVVDTEAIPLSHAAVTVYQSNREVAKAACDGTGRFSVGQLGGGVYQLVAGSGTALVRVWAPGTAPPDARSMVLIVSGDPVVRGQFMRLHLGRRLVTGAVIAGAIAAPIVYSESNSRDGVPVSP